MEILEKQKSMELSECVQVFFKEFDVLFRIFKFYSSIPVKHMCSELTPRSPSPSPNLHTNTHLNFRQLLKFARDFLMIPMVVTQDVLFEHFGVALQLDTQSKNEYYNNDNKEVGITFPEFLVVLGNIAISTIQVRSPLHKGVSLLQYMHKSNGLKSINSDRASAVASFDLSWANAALNFL
jgi:hypothetical protein